MDLRIDDDDDDDNKGLPPFVSHARLIYAALFELIQKPKTVA